MIRLAVNGALGRMGSRILNLAMASPDFKVLAAFENDPCRFLGQDLGDALGMSEKMKIKLSVVSAERLRSCDVVIDFSSPAGTRTCLEAALKAGARMVIGTTGVDPDTEEEIRRGSKKTAILYSPNMSLGANFLFQVAKLAATQLKAGYDIEIVEAHHRLKKDAPSGTAKKLAEVIAQTKGWDLDKTAKYGRKGLTGERPDREIGIHVIRAGEIVGEHTVLFSGPGETIEFTHKAQSRDAFARGALSAAHFLSKRKTGLFTMLDVLLTFA
ncbi:MAG: 4-hydroxy-tetrahydrodipicolinate reductase [Candidatus Omnitrophica bacterium]|nr:4-hydroxy-tetrahydrodipicolinate reductase [Candidatus Omnitrophota bacterium]